MKGECDGFENIVLLKLWYYCHYKQVRDPCDPTTTVDYVDLQLSRTILTLHSISNKTRLSVTNLCLVVLENDQTLVIELFTALLSLNSESYSDTDIHTITPHIP